MKNPSMKAGAGFRLSAIQANPSTFCPPALAHREATALRCLAVCTHSREQLDRAAGVSNSPDVIMRLRRMGFMIACTRRRATDKHGKPCYPGDYTLSTAHIDAALDALRAFDAAERKRKEAVQ